MGFHSRRPRNSSSSRCICSCKECFSPSIWLKLICSLHWTWKRICKFTHLQSPTCSLRGKFYKQFEFVSVTQIVCLNHAGQPFTFTIEVPQHDWKIICLVEDQTKSFLISIESFWWCELYTVYMFQIVSTESFMLKPTKQSFLDILQVSRGTIWRRRSLLWVKMFNSLKISLIILMRRLNQMMLIKQIWG